MINKDFVIDIFAVTRNITTTSKLLHISKQRVWQIVRKVPVKKLLRLCILCHKKAVIIRRIDGDEKNDFIQNLIPLCLEDSQLVDREIVRLLSEAKT